MLPTTYQRPSSAPAPSAPDRPAPARDVWVDAVRAASLLVVVLGHWLLAVVGRGHDGALDIASLLSAAPEVHWLGLGLQVMGAFFFVGGSVSVTSWRRAAIGGRGAYGPWLRARAGRLVGPVLPLLGLWAVLPPVLGWLGLDARLATAAGLSALAPLWFLVVYLLVQALVPVIDVVTTRVGWPRAVAGLVVGSAVVDLLGRGLGLAWAGYGGYLTVWIVPVVLGVALADGRLGVREGRRLAFIGAAGVAALVGLAGYPLLMVGTLSDGGSNQNPPSLALAALILCHVGLLLMTRSWLTARLSRPRATRATAVAAAWSMPLFLWHMSAMSLAIGASLLSPLATAGLLGIEPLSLAWWVARPAWWAVLAVWTLPLLVGAQRWDALLAVGRPGSCGAGRALLGCAAAIVALAVGSAAIGTTPVALVMVGLLGAAAALLGALPVGTGRGR